MKVKTIALIGVLIIAVFVAACSQPESNKPANTGEPAKTETKTEPAKDSTATAPPAGHDTGHASGSKEETPAAVKAAFPEAKSITMQHKDLTANHVSTLEKDYGVKVKPTDFHSYVAYGSGSGKRTQLGAATLVDVEGAGEPAQLVIVYSNDIVIKKITPVKGSGDAVSSSFLDQFVEKDHDQPFQVGKDIKYNGNNKAAAEAVANAIKRDILSMQMLYGKAHSH
jgi:hypothetical protein